MTKETISTGSSANDGTGDTLRGAGTKINSNFTELYTKLGDGTTLSSLTFPTGTDTIVGRATTDTLTNKTLTTPTIASVTNGGTVTIPSGADTLVARTSTDTLTNKTLTSPKVGTAIADTNGNELIKVTATSSAVNEFTLANGASTTGPTLSATGGGANLNIFLTTKGTGSVQVSKAAYTSATITADGDASDAATYIICNKGSALAVGLNDGTTVGEYRIFTNKGAGTATVTPDNFAGGTSFALAQNEGCTCVWDGANWFLVGNQSAMTIA